MASLSTSSLSPPIFNGKNYQVWAVKMKAYLRGLGLWQWVETERQVPPLGNNPTLNQIKAYDDEETKALRALVYIHPAVSKSIFTRIMACETLKEAWNKLKEMYRVNVNGIVTREEIEWSVREVMEGERRKEIMRNCERWRQSSVEAVSEGGSSDINIDHFVCKVISNKV